MPKTHIDSERVYAASIAHKANCHLDREKNNSHYDSYEHPRFGFLKCIRLSKDVEAGEEIFVEYDYNTEQPDWFRRDNDNNKEQDNST